MDCGAVRCGSVQLALGKVNVAVVVVLVMDFYYGFGAGRKRLIDFH